VSLRDALEATFLVPDELRVTLADAAYATQNPKCPVHACDIRIQTYGSEITDTDALAITGMPASEGAESMRIT
jgi:hypothetical protein